MANVDVILLQEICGQKIIVEYNNGTLIRIETTNEKKDSADVSYLAGRVNGLPVQIADRSHLVILGTVTISWECQDEVGKKIWDLNHFLSTSVLNYKQGKMYYRLFDFVAYDIANDSRCGSKAEQYDILNRLGFSTLQYWLTSMDDMKEELLEMPEVLDICSDLQYRYPPLGLILEMNNLAELRMSGRRNSSRRIQFFPDSLDREVVW